MSKLHNYYADEIENKLTVKWSSFHKFYEICPRDNKQNL